MIQEYFKIVTHDYPFHLVTMTTLQLSKFPILCLNNFSADSLFTSKAQAVYAYALKLFVALPLLLCAATLDFLAIPIILCRELVSYFQHFGCRNFHHLFHLLALSEGRSVIEEIVYTPLYVLALCIVSIAKPFLCVYQCLIGKAPALFNKKIAMTTLKASRWNKSRIPTAYLVMQCLDHRHWYVTEDMNIPQIFLDSFHRPKYVGGAACLDHIWAKLLLKFLARESPAYHAQAKHGLNQLEYLITRINEQRHLLFFTSLANSGAFNLLSQEADREPPLTYALLRLRFTFAQVLVSAGAPVDKNHLFSLFDRLFNPETTQAEAKRFTALTLNEITARIQRINQNPANLQQIKLNIEILFQQSETLKSTITYTIQYLFDKKRNPVPGTIAEIISLFLPRTSKTLNILRLVKKPALKQVKS
jgi:hypothetical protein